MIESSLESNSPNILALCETNLDDSIDSGNFSMRGYLPLIQKDSSTYMHGLAGYVKEGLVLHGTCVILMFSTGLTSRNVLLLFLYQSPSWSLCTVFGSISSNIDEAVLINPSTNVFVFGDFNDRHMDWLAHSGGIDRSGELCFNFFYLKRLYSD